MQRYLKLVVPTIFSLCLLTACGGNGGADVDGDGGGFEGESLMRQWLERLYLLI